MRDAQEKESYRLRRTVARQKTVKAGLALVSEAASPPNSTSIQHPASSIQYPAFTPYQLLFSHTRTHLTHRTRSHAHLL